MDLEEIVVTAPAAPLEFPSFLTSTWSLISTPAFATVGVAVIGLTFPSSLSANDTCDNGNCNTMNAKATGTPPVPGATPGPETRGPSQQWEKPGGKAEADKDFDNLKPKDVKPIPGGRTGTLPDGRSVNVRDRSTDGRPTLEIQDGPSRIKVRYN